MSAERFCLARRAAVSAARNSFRSKTTWMVSMWNKLHSIFHNRARSLDCAGALADERKQLVAGFVIVAESAEHGAGDGAGVLFLNAAHHHTEMTSLADHADSPGFDQFLYSFGNLLCETFLDLEPPREDIHDPRNLTESDYL
jgi:hypothetical protein